MEEQMNAPELLLSFVVDNGPSAKGKLGGLMPALRRFAADMAEKPNVAFEVVGFDGFAPAVLKTFEEREIRPAAAGKMPLLGRAVQAALGRLEARVAELEKAGRKAFRPWLFILSDGMTLDSMEETVLRLERAEREGKLMYLPFKLSPGLISERLQSLDRTKHMIEVMAGRTEDLFAFVAKMVQMRETIPAEEQMKFNKSDFEGWALL